MKKIILTLIGIVGMGCFTSCMASKKTVVEERDVESFSSIEMDGVAGVYFTQDSKCSVRIEGEETDVRNTEITVKDGTLYIETNSRKGRNQKGTKIYLTAPDLDELSFDGVGSFRCEKTLKVDDIRIDVDGVGSVEMEDLKCETLRLSVDGVGKTDVHVTCRDLRADLDGVGKVVLSGSADHARISKDGVGVCNTNNLKIGK